MAMVEVVLFKLNCIMKTESNNKKRFYFELKLLTKENYSITLKREYETKSRNRAFSFAKRWMNRQMVLNKSVCGEIVCYAELELPI